MSESVEIEKRPRGNPNWLPGVSGNPIGGLPKPNLEKTQARVKAMALNATPEIMKKMIEIALADDTPAQTRLLYCKEVMDKGIGKTPKAVEIKADLTNDPVNLLAGIR